MDGKSLEKLYQENLSERMISELASVKGISYENAMALYYNSRLSRLIQNGEYDIQYLDYKVLTQMLCEELAK